MPVPASLEIPVETMKRDGGERKPSGEETPSKKQKVVFADEKALEKEKSLPSTSVPAGQLNPVTPIPSPLRAPSAPSRPREAFGLLEEESPMKKLRPSDDSSKKAKVNVVKVAGENLYHVDEELSPLAEKVDEEDWGEEGVEEEEEEEVNGLECYGVMENMNQNKKG